MKKNIGFQTTTLFTAAVFLLCSTACVKRATVVPAPDSSQTQDQIKADPVSTSTAVKKRPQRRYSSLETNNVSAGTPDSDNKRLAEFNGYLSSTASMKPQKLKGVDHALNVLGVFGGYAIALGAGIAFVTANHLIK